MTNEAVPHLDFLENLANLDKTIFMCLRNQFRKEWYGFGKKEEIYSIFRDQDFGVKIIEVTGI